MSTITPIEVIPFLRSGVSVGLLISFLRNFNPERCLNFVFKPFKNMYFYISTNVINIHLAPDFSLKPMKKQLLVWIVTGSVLYTSCKQQDHELTRIEGSITAVSDTLKAIDSLETFIAPYRQRIDEVLDTPLAYNPEPITENDGIWNTSAGNLMADIVLEMSQPLWKSKTGREIDLVVLNHGGVRGGVPVGEVTARNAYELMPFENNINIITLNGKELRELVAFLVNAGRPNPIAGMQIILNPQGSLEAVNIGGRPFDESRDYTVATSSYLVEGGSDVGFFPTYSEVADLEYKMRNAIIDYFKKVDTIYATVDDRFYQLP